jgi:hypothetical protein
MADEKEPTEVKEEPQETEISETTVEDTEESEETKPPEEPKETTEPEAEEEPDIPVRSNASYIIDRQKRTIEKLRSKTDEQEEEPSSLEERLERIEQIALGQADERELTTFFFQEPDAKKYEKQIRVYMSHDAYKAVPPEVIYAYVSRKDRFADADKKRAAADLEAKQTKTAGSSVRDKRSRGTKTADDIKNMTDAEFREYEREQAKLART